MKLSRFLSILALSLALSGFLSAMLEQPKPRLIIHSTVGATVGIISQSKGNGLTQVWKQTGGPVAVTLQAPKAIRCPILFTRPGVYSFLLTVTDKVGLTDTATIFVNIK